MPYSYYLKEQDKENGHYQFILRRERSAFVTCLRLNDREWKDKYFFTSGELVNGTDDLEISRPTREKQVSSVCFNYVHV